VRKKAGIITFHFADNFGAVLQAYALLKVIRDVGCNVEIINFVPAFLREPYNLFFNIRSSIYQKGLIATIKRLIIKILRFRHQIRRIKEFQDFRDNFLVICEKKYVNASQIRSDKPKYEYYITGSDQVWNPDFFSKVGDTYFLDFAEEGSKKIAYAVSIAKDKVDNVYNEVYQRHLKDFDYISVREKSAKTFLSNFTEKDIHVTLDPTLLLDKEEWLKIAAESSIKEKYILVYDLVKNPIIVSLANKVAEELNCKIVSYSNKKGYNKWYGSFGSLNPTKFLGLCSKAEFIVTSSFHGTVFAIIFNKPFFTILHPTRGSRMIDLLNDLDLSDRIIKDINQLNIMKEIDFNKVNERLTELKSKSMDFLKTALS